MIPRGFRLDITAGSSPPRKRHPPAKRKRNSAKFLSNKKCSRVGRCTWAKVIYKFIPRLVVRWYDGGHGFCGGVMYTPVVRVLIADDFEAWRVKLRAILEENPALRVVGEAQTGVEIVQQAQTLKPELLVLDIGLPILSGLEAARILAEADPKAKVLFVSENRHWEIAEEALRQGALGYVVKSDAGADLLPAIDAVLMGRQFVSASLRDRWLGDAEGDKPGASLQTRNSSVRHEVAFYADDEALERGFARAIEASLNQKNPVLLIATDSHRHNIGRNLQERHVDLHAAIKEGRYIQVDVVSKLSEIMANESPDFGHCVELIEDIIRSSAEVRDGVPGRIAIFGECAPMLLRQGDFDGAALLERLWNEIKWTHSVETLCGYIWGAFPAKEATPIFHRICAEHTAVRGSELGH